MTYMCSVGRETLLSQSYGSRIRDPDRNQNLIICSLAHCLPSLKISCKSVRKFLRKVADRQTNRHTTTIKAVNNTSWDFGA